MDLRSRLAPALVLALACVAGPEVRAQQLPAAPTPQSTSPIVDAPAPQPNRQPDLPAAPSSAARTSARLPPPPPSIIPGFAAYESCGFPDRLAVVGRTPLNGGVTLRDAETSHGTVAVQLEAGERVLFAYPGQDLFANVRLEKLPTKDFLNQKRTLIEDFNHTLAQSPLGVRNYSLPARMRGFEIYGLDRVELSGSVLGIYVFFDDLNRIATTVWFLNQDNVTRPFQTIDQYARLRDAFLKTYTACIRTHQGVLVLP